MAAVKLAIGMVTCDRRQFGKQDYLGRTLASLDASGFFHQIEGDEFKRHLLRHGHHHLLELGFRTEAHQPDFAARGVLCQIGCFIERVAGPGVQDRR